MATIAFAAATAGTAITATAFATGMLMAGIIDQMFVMPLLFPAEPVEGMRIGEIGLMGADEGMPVTYAFGQYAKVAGQIIWVHNLEEVSITERVGKSGKRITYYYYISHAVAICNVGRNAAGSATALSSVDAVFADEKRVYANARTLQQDSTTDNGLRVYLLGTTAYVVFVDSTAVSSFYNKWAVGDTLSWTGWANGENNDANDIIVDKRIIDIPTGTGTGKDGSGGDVISYSAFQMLKSKVEESAGESVTGTGVQYSGWADDIQRSGEPTIYLGANASHNSHMNAAGTFDNIKYYDTAYIVFDSLSMADFGTRIPNWEFIVSSHADYRTVPGVISQLMSLANFTSAQFSVSDVASQILVGYSMRGPTSTQKLLQPIMITFNILAQERGQCIFFMDRVNNVANTYTIDMDAVGAAAGTEPKYMGIEIQNTPMNQKFGEVTFTHISQDDSHFPQGQAKAQLAPHTNTFESVHDLTKFQINTPIVCTNAFANEVAHRVLFASHADDMKFIFRLSVKQSIKYQENDRVNITVNGRVYPILIHKVTLGADMIAEVEGALDRAIEQDFSMWQEGVGAV